VGSIDSPPVGIDDLLGNSLRWPERQPLQEDEDFTQAIHRFIE